MWRSFCDEVTVAKLPCGEVTGNRQHCVDLTGLGIEPQISLTDSVRLATELMAGLV